MERFIDRSLSGQWWFPNTPDVRFHGDLHLKNDHHGTLTLQDTTNDLLKYTQGHEGHTLHGQIAAGYAYNATLFQAIVSETSSSDGKTKVVFFTNEILVGGHFGSNKDPFIRSASISLSGLEEWCDNSGFSGKYDYSEQRQGAVSFSLEYRRTRSDPVSLGAGTSLCFSSNFSGPMFFGDKKIVTLKEEDLIELHFDEKISLHQLRQEMRIWQSFFTISLRRQSLPIDVRISTEGNDCCYKLLVPGWYQRAHLNRRRPNEVILNKSKLGADISKYIKAWWEVFNTIENSVMLFASVEYQEGIFTHLKILSYLQALEVLHRELYGASRVKDKELWKRILNSLRGAIPNEVEEPLKNQLFTQLGFLGQITLQDRLKDLFDLYPKCLSQLFPNKEQDMSLLKDVRNFLTHYTGNKKINKSFLSSRQLLILNEKTRLFVEVCLLGTMGMTDEQLLALFNQFETFCLVRAEKHQ